MTSAGTPKPEPSVRLSSTHGKCVADAALDIRALPRPVEPHKVRLFAEPDQLSACIATVLLGDERPRRRLITDATQHLHHLAVHESPEGTRVGRNSRPQQLPHFVHDAACKLLVHAPPYT